MRKSRSVTQLSLACPAVLLLSAAAEAAVTRFVASSGNDANACTLAAPCRTLQRGINVTPVGGELVVLDSASYGSAATILQSITISADGVSATLLNPGGVTIGGAGIVVALRGLHLNGGVAGGSGILIEDAAAVHIENCVVEGFARGRHPARTSGSNAKLFVIDSVARDNGGDGLHVIGTATMARLTVDNSRFENNAGDGLDVEGIESAITRTVISANGSDGIEQTGGRMNVTWTEAASNGGNGFVVTVSGAMTVDSSVARGNTSNGLLLGSGSASATVSNSVFTDNAIGIANAGTTLLTRENNTIAGNASPQPVIGPRPPLPGF